MEGKSGENFKKIFNQETVEEPWLQNKF
jgi:hypothetical protein